MHTHGDNIFAIICWQFLIGWLVIVSLTCCVNTARWVSSNAVRVAEKIRNVITS